MARQISVAAVNEFLRRHRADDSLEAVLAPPAQDLPPEPELFPAASLGFARLFDEWLVEQGGEFRHHVFPTAHGPVTVYSFGNLAWSECDFYPPCVVPPSLEAWAARLVGRLYCDDEFSPASLALASQGRGRPR